MPLTSRIAAAAAAVACAVAAAGVPPAVAATAPAPTVTLSFAGDTILGNTPQLPPSPSTYLAAITPSLHKGVDVAFGNLEGTLTTATSSKCAAGSTSCYAFRNPPAYAHTLAAAGFGIVGLANNHSHDFGAAGLRSTEAALTGAHVVYTGLPGQIGYLTRRSTRIAVVAFAPYGNTNNLLDLSRAAALIKTARAHAPIVVVYMHAGAEGSAADHVTGREEYYVGEDRGNPRKFAHMAIDNGATLVVASGPHVLRGMEFYKGRLAAYSLGNFANFHNFNTSGVLARSAILRVTVTTGGAFRSARLVSVVLNSSGHAQPGGSSVSFVASLSRHDFGSAAPLISSAGDIRHR